MDAANPLSAWLDEEIGRRAALRRTLTGASLLAGATLLPTGCSGYPEAPAGVHVLTAKELAVVRAVMDTFVPVTADGMLSVDDVGAPLNFDRTLRTATPKVRKELGQLFLIVEHGPIVFARKLSRFTSMSPEDRRAYIDGLMRSDSPFQKTVWIVLKKIALGSYYDLPETWERLGYAGPMKTHPAAPGPMGNSTRERGHPRPEAPGPLRIPTADQPDF